MKRKVLALLSGGAILVIAGCVGGYRGEPSADALEHETLLGDANSAADFNVCDEELPYVPKDIKVDRLLGRFHVTGRAYFEKDNRYETIDFEAYYHGDVYCEQSTGAVIVKSSGSVHAHGKKPLVRTPRVPGASPRFIEAMIKGPSTTDVGTSTLIVSVHDRLKKEYFCFEPDAPGPGEAPAEYLVCFPEHRPVSLRPGVLYEIDDKTVREVNCSSSK